MYLICFFVLKRYHIRRKTKKIVYYVIFSLQITCYLKKFQYSNSFMIFLSPLQKTLHQENKSFNQFLAAL